MGGSPRVSFQRSCGHEVESSTETSQGGYSLRVIPQYTYRRNILLMFTSLVPRPSPSFPPLEVRSRNKAISRTASGRKLGEDLGMRLDFHQNSQGSQKLCVENLADLAPIWTIFFEMSLLRSNFYLGTWLHTHFREGLDSTYYDMVEVTLLRKEGVKVGSI